MKGERIVVAMSGGVDSSTAAALLVDAGYEVVGVTLKLTDATGTSASIGGRCCGPRDIEDARATAALLGFPHYVLDETATFKHAVIDDFVAEHAAGRTPNPCVRCNEKLKFGPLLRFARAVGARRLATGHYARLVRDGEGPIPALLRAQDRDKDQSYFLFGVPAALFTAVAFPLGETTKDQVRHIARRFGLPNADKPDSQQICFVPDGDHKAFVEARGGAGRPGDIVDENGARLADHRGTHRFTVGQRRGVPIDAGDLQRRFVLRIEAATGRVIVGPREALQTHVLQVSDLRWTSGRVPEAWPLRCGVQIRHRAAAAPAWVAAPVGSNCAVNLDTPALGVAPGQAAVFYDGDRVVGGGWISG